MQVSTRKPWEALIEQDNSEALYFDGLDDAVVGIGYRHTKQPLVVYSQTKILDILAAQAETDRSKFMSNAECREMALEWFGFNIEGAWCGEGTPIIIYDDPDHREE